MGPERRYSGSVFDEASLSLHAGPRFLIDADTEASILATARQHWLGTVKDHHALGGRIEAGHRLTQRATIFGRVSLEDRHYRTRTSLDGTALNVSLVGAYVITPTVRADVSAGYGQDRPDRMRERNERYRLASAFPSSSRWFHCERRRGLPLDQLRARLVPPCPGQQRS